jgi:hypothetical protein
MQYVEIMRILQRFNMAGIRINVKKDRIQMDFDDKALKIAASAERGGYHHV